MKKYLAIITLSLALAGCQPQQTVKLDYQTTSIITPTMTTTPTVVPTTASSVSGQAKTQGNFAVIKTTLGDIKIELYPDKTPITVANFIGLATGEKEWTDPATGKKMVNKPFFDGIIFHRVIKDFMIQTGDPLGKGFGGPGYKFADETFDGEYMRGTVAMANSGPNTNGSQFFIMHKDMSLPKNYVIFGKVFSGIDVVDKIAQTPTDASDKPLKDVSIKTIIIENK